MNTSFFERAPDANCPKGRILLLSYHFPPGQTAGAMRWQKLSSFAHERGWGLDVVTLDPASLPSPDDSRLADLPEGVRVYGVPTRELPLDRLEERALHFFRRFQRRLEEPNTNSEASANQSGSATPGASANPSAAHLARVSARGVEKIPSSFKQEETRFEIGSARSWLRAYWAWRSFVCDADWSRRVAALGQEILEAESHRLILTCGPPHMLHEAARGVARRSGLPHVVDMRDPWSQGERIPEHVGSPLWYFLARRYERRTIRDASLVVMNTEPAQRALQSRYPSRADSIIAVPNAYDEHPLPDVPRDPRFLIAFAGTIYLDRTPRTLFQACGRLVAEQSLTPADLGIEFMGTIGKVDGESLDDIAAAYGLTGFVRTRPPGPHAEAQQFLASASMLVSLPQDSHLAIPSKVYEYMGFAARILIFADRDSATELLLRDTSANVVAPEDVETTFNVLRCAYRDQLDGKSATPIANDVRFSRRARAQHLLDAIDGVLGDVD